MATFRFRAEAALDLRKREEREALLARGLAEARFREVHETLEAERRRRETAQQNLVHVERQGSDVDTVLWHRNWIVRLAANIDQLVRELEARAREVKAADRVWREARKRRMALERMRELALQRFQKDELRQEMKSMDELARIRFAMPDSWRTET
jgi:flagellar export protein FliJ